MNFQLFILKSIRLFIIISDKFSKRLTAKLLVNLFFRPKRHKHPMRELPFLESAEKFTFQHNSIDVKGYKWGKISEKRVLLVHGWEGRATQMYQFITPLLDQNYEVFSFDGIAHGFTAGKDTNMPEMSFLLKHMMNTYKIDHIIAHSFGGMASTFAIKSGVIKPKTVSFVGAPYDIDYILESFLSIFGLNGKYEEAIIQHVEKRVNLTYDKFQFDTYKKTTKTKLLLIHDEYDKEVLFSEMKKFLPMWEHVEQLITNGLGHRRILKEERVISRICDFIGTTERKVRQKGA